MSTDYLLSNIKSNDIGLPAKREVQRRQTLCAFISYSLGSLKDQNQASDRFVKNDF